jgi:hypothetical protein
MFPTTNLIPCNSEYIYAWFLNSAPKRKTQENLFFPPGSMRIPPLLPPLYDNII